MNLQNLMAWVIGIVTATAAVGKLDVLQRWIWTSEARTIEAAKTSEWGSPRFFPKNAGERLKDSSLSRPDR
ncbi:MAG: hypothetical protein EOP06_19610 [Proteobacteria bacterium]|nr:MAG: hypothetical protein EOP06_19610 [Pseudomonadota bacterium]